jgi:hypothetical protein
MKWLALTATAALLAACSAAGASSSVKLGGPLGTMQLQGTVGICGTQITGLKYVLGWELLRNTDSRPVTITSVKLTHAHNLSLEQARVATIPKGPNLLVGTWHGFHPNFRSSPRIAKEMNTSKPAVRATVPPFSQHGDRENLVLYLQAAPPNGGYSGPVSVTYKDANGNDHLWIGGSAMSFRPGKACT